MSTSIFFRQGHSQALCLALLITTTALPAAELPRVAELQYVGPFGVPASMHFSRKSNDYKVVVRLNAPFYPMRFESSGTINGDTL
ncbi:MAG: hypothetical protein Q4G39_06350, partial [Brachymonas sp.]|nr:hypothetical protein [Brachymonas sp.]